MPFESVTNTDILYPYAVSFSIDDTVLASPNAMDPAVPPMTIVASLPEGEVPVATEGYPCTWARIWIPDAPEDKEPEVNCVRACPKARLVVATAAVGCTTGDTLSPPPVGLSIENSTCTLPTGRLLLSLTVATRVEYGQVVPTHFPTRPGEACSVML